MQQMTAFCDITQLRNRETEHDTATLLDRCTHTLNPGLFSCHGANLAEANTGCITCYAKRKIRWKMASADALRAPISLTDKSASHTKTIDKSY